MQNIFHILSGHKDTHANIGFHKNITPLPTLDEKDKVNLQIPSKGAKNIDMTWIRGIADAQSLRFLYHDPDIHKSCHPADPHTYEIYNNLEQIRIESVGSREMKGTAENLRYRFNKEIAYAGLEHITDIKQLAPSVGYELLMRYMLGEKQLSPTARKIAQAFQTTLPQNVLQNLKNAVEHIDDQKYFAQSVCYALNDTNSLSPSESQETTQKEKKEDLKTSQTQDQKNNTLEDTRQDDIEDHRQEDIDAPLFDQNALSEPTRSQKEQTHLLANLQDFLNGIAPPPEQSEDDRPYKIYTSQFDEIVTPEDLCTPAELFALRKELDGYIASRNNLVPKMARKFQRFLMTTKNTQWNFNVENGVLDPQRLSQIVTSPLSTPPYRQEKEARFPQTIVTLLIDNSGSMRQRPAAIAAICADLLAKTLEKCDVKTEILGFTTRHWKGGESRKLWIENNKPQHPGRLNDLRHIIYKSEHVNYNKARQYMGLMLHDDLLKENIDGEALLWAAQRLMRSSQKRKILMVISDGAPVDDSTLSTNSSDYLKNHLIKTINFIQDKLPIELTAIGIGHDVTSYYKRAITLNDVDDLGKAMLTSLTELFKQNDKHHHAC